MSIRENSEMNEEYKCIEQKNDSRVMYVTGSGFIKIIDISSWNSYQYMLNEMLHFSCFFRFGDRVFAASIITLYSDYDILVWSEKKKSVENLLRGHTNVIRCMDVFRNNLSDYKLISSGDDCTIKLWNLETGNCEQEFTDHRGPIISLKVCDDNLYTLSSDKSIRIWNLRTKKWEFILLHPYAVRNFIVYPEDDVIISGGRNAEYDMSSYYLWLWRRNGDSYMEKTKIAHTSNMIDVKIVDRYTFLTVAYEESIKLWDLQTFKHIFTIQVKTKKRVHLHKDTIIVETSKKNIQIWNLFTRSKCLEIQTSSEIKKTEILCEYLLCYGNNNSLEIFDIQHGSFVKTLFTLQISHLITPIQHTSKSQYIFGDSIIKNGRCFTDVLLLFKQDNFPIEEEIDLVSRFLCEKYKINKTTK